MTTNDYSLSRLLIYVNLSEDVNYERLPLELLSSLDIILLGIYPVTDQASPEQTRDSFEEDAREQLQSVVDTFALTDIDPKTVLKFTSDPVETMNHIAAEKQCDAILTPGNIEQMNHILVPYKGTEHTETLTTFISDMLKESPKQITLIRFVEDDEEKEKHRRELTQFRQTLVSGGVDENAIQIRVEEADDLGEALLREIDEHDLAILGESESDVSDLILGGTHEEVLTNTVVPLITVRFPGEEGEQQQIRSEDM